MPLYPQIYPWIARLLQDSARKLDDEYFDLDIASEIRENLPTGILYENLVGDDKPRVDEAIGHLVAARKRAPLATGGAGKELTSEKTETATRGFSGGELLDEEWRAHAARLLRRCTFTPPDESTTGGGLLGFYGLNGPSRAREERRRDE